MKKVIHEIKKEYDIIGQVFCDSLMMIFANAFIGIFLFSFGFLILDGGDVDFLWVAVTIPIVQIATISYMRTTGLRMSKSDFETEKVVHKIVSQNTRKARK